MTYKDKTISDVIEEQLRALHKVQELKNDKTL